MSMEPDDESDDRIEEEPASAMEAEKDVTDAVDDDENYVEEEETDTARLAYQSIHQCKLTVPYHCIYLRV